MEMQQLIAIGKCGNVHAQHALIKHQTRSKLVAVTDSVFRIDHEICAAMFKSLRARTNSF